MSKTTNSRTLDRLRELGYMVQIVERYNHFAMIRQDLFGFIDVLAMKAGEPVLAVQATTYKQISARIRKIVSLHELSRTWLATGNNLEVWGWKKEGRYWQPDVRKLEFDPIKQQFIALHNADIVKTYPIIYPDI